MVIDMNEAQVRTVQQILQVLAGTQELGFSLAQDDQQRDDWIRPVPQRLHYRHLGRADRGVVAYLRHLSGYSRAQINRLVARAMTHTMHRSPSATTPPRPASHGITPTLTSSYWVR